MSVSEYQQETEQVVAAPRPKPVYDFFKRLFDILLSAFALVALSPLFLVVAILIKKEDGGTVFYSQTRLTKGGKEFHIIFSAINPQSTCENGKVVS